MTEGVTLTIEPGVNVKVNSGLYIKNEGIIIAVGTSGNKITFESSSVSPAKSDWSGIRIRPTGGSAIDGSQNYSSGSQFKYVVIKHADIGLYIYDAGLHVSYTEFDTNNYGVEIRKTDGVVIDNSTFTENTAGIWSEYETYSPDDTTGNILNTFIKNSEFNNNNYGIDLIINQRYFENLNINNNTINENTVGIDFSGGGYGCRVKSVNIFKNSIYNNSGNGLQVGQIYGYEGFGSEPADTYPLNVEKNIIVNNPVYWNYGGGVSGVTVKIANNIIYNPSETSDSYSQGLYFTGGTSKNDLITGNLIVSNGASLNLEDSYTDPSNKTFSFNTFIGQPLESNSTISIYGTGHVFSNNNFTKVNSNYVIKNTFSATINAENNYWGTINESEIQAAIYDFGDDFELGAVDYSPFSTSMNTTAPISPPANVTKSVSGSDVILNWSANEESDLVGYKLHYGSPTGYSYTSTVDLGNVTTYTITGGDIATEYAITSYDSSLDGTDDVVDGNESWFSVANQLNVTLNSSTTSISEPTNSATLTATLDNTSSADVVVNLTYTGTATNATDYSAAASITIPFGSLTATTAITAIDDTDVELTETIIIDMGDVSGASESGTQQVTINLTDNDLPSASITVDNLTIQEDGGVSVITATLSAIHSKSTTIPLTISGTATLDTDYSTDFVSGTISGILAGGNGQGSANNQFNFGSNPYGWTYDGGEIEVDSSGNIYIADTQNNRVIKWAPGADEGTVVAGGNGAGSNLNQLNNPTDIHVDSSGNLYVLDTYNNRIVIWAPDATVGVLRVDKNNGAWSWSNTFWSFDVDISGNVYTTDWNDYVSKVHKWADVSDPTSFSLITDMGESAVEIEIDDSNNIYVIANGQYVKKKLSGVDDWEIVAAGFGVNKRDFQVDSAGNIYVLDTANNWIMKWLPGASAYDGVLVKDGLSDIVDINLDELNNIYFSDRTSNAIKKIQISPAINIVAGSSTGTLTITGIEDSVYDEGNETIILTPSTPVNGTLASSDATTITITNKNYAPVATAQTDLAATEQTEVTITLAGTDSENDTLSYIIVSLPTNGTLSDDGTVITADDLPKTTTSADVVYVSTSDTATSDSFTFKVNDGTVDSEAAATVSLAITAVNDAAVAVEDAATVLEDAELTSIDVIANDTDVDADTLTLTAVTTDGTGTVAVNADGVSVDYTPALDFNGTEVITYTVSDGTVDTTGTLTITVTAVNDAPVVNNHSILLAEQGTVSALENGETTLLYNASDVEGDDLVAILVTEPSNGILNLNSDGTFSYEHDGSETTSDSFTYKASDGNLESEVAITTITITNVNDNTPTDIVLSNNTVNENESNLIIGQFSAIDVDLPSDSHTYELVSGSGDDNNASFTINGNNLENIISFDFETLNELSIRVRVTDENNESYEKILNIIVLNINDINISFEITDTYCSGDIGDGTITINSISEVSGDLTFLWTASNNGVIPSGQSNNQSLTNLSPGTYNLSLSDSFFTYEETFDVQLISQYDGLSICYISSDETDVTNNRIFLNNEGNYNVAYYEILRESNIADVYESVGTVESTNNSFLDNTSDNTSQVYRYKVRLVDNCDIISVDSDYHETILLQSSLSATNSINLSWSSYSGVDYSTYNIYRKVNEGSFEFLSSVSSSNNTYNDQTADVTNNNYEYYIAIFINDCNTSAGKVLDTTELRSNIQSVSDSFSINEINLFDNLSIYPNPTNSSLNIKLHESLSFIKSEIYNVLGQIIMKTEKTNFLIDHLSDGTYFIKVFTDKGLAIKKFVKN